MATFNDVLKELAEMQAIGMRGAAKGASFVKANPTQVDGYLISMDVSEVADLAISLAS